MFNYTGIIKKHPYKGAFVVYTSFYIDIFKINEETICIKDNSDIEINDYVIIQEKSYKIINIYKENMFKGNNYLKVSIKSVDKYDI